MSQLKRLNGHCLLVATALTLTNLATGEEPEEFSLPAERLAALKVQLFLDDKGFGPGRIDGRWGGFTRKAAERWNKVEGKPAIPISTASDLQSGGGNVWSADVLTTYKITPADQQLVGSVPEKPAAQAAQKSMPYESLLELVSERFHSLPEFVLELNGLDDVAKLTTGQEISVPNVSRPFDLNAIKAGSPEDSKTKETYQVIVLRKQEIVEIREGDQLARSYPITVGADGNSSPTGDWKVEVIQWMPEFRYDEQMLKEGERSDNSHMLPPGPNNPVGIVWIGLDADGIGLHGTGSPDTIGRSASHGCIRLSNWDARQLGQLIKTGTEVKIR